MGASGWGVAAGSRARRPLGRDDALDSLEIGSEFDLMEAGEREHSFNGGRLAVSDFGGDETAGDETIEGLGDEAAVDIEAVGAGEEREGGLVVADFDGKGGPVDCGNVWRVGGDDVELLTDEGGEKVAMEESDGNSIAICVLAGEVEGFGREVCCRDGGMGEMVGEGDGDGTRACADVEDAGETAHDRGFAFPPIPQWARDGWGTQVSGEQEDFFNKVFGLRAWNQHVRSYAKGQAVELGFAGDVLDRLASAAALDESPQFSVDGRCRVAVGVCDEPGTVSFGRCPFQDKKQKRLRIKPGALRMRSCGERLLTLCDEGAER